MDKLTKKIQLYKSPPGEISTNGCWVIIQENCWLYTSNTRFGVLWELITEWKNDRHLVG